MLGLEKNPSLEVKRTTETRVPVIFLLIPLNDAENLRNGTKRVQRGGIKRAFVVMKNNKDHIITDKASVLLGVHPHTNMEHH